MSAIGQKQSWRNINLMKKAREFAARPAADQKWMLQNTWCDACGQADLGMTAPYEYEENTKVFLEGICNRCGGVVVSEVIEHEGGHP